MTVHLIPIPWLWPRPSRLERTAGQAFNPVQKGRFAHRTPDGFSPAQRLGQFSVFACLDQRAEVGIALGNGSRVNYADSAFNSDPQVRIQFPIASPSLAAMPTRRYTLPLAYPAGTFSR